MHRAIHHLLGLALLPLLSCRDSSRLESAGRSGAASEQEDATIRITVDPHTTRRIAGHSELERKRYFAICDSGQKFDRRMRENDWYDYLVRELGVNFGRDLGLVNGLAKNRKVVREDPDRPGFADTKRLAEYLAPRRAEPSRRMRADFGPNLDVALHGQHNAYPEFMGSHLSAWLRKEVEEGHPAKDRLPANIEAAAELAATVLRHRYDDFTRPRYYEPINEPHWSYFNESHLADWHLATMRRVHAETPDVLVGGPCLSVGYFYSKGYHSFKGLRQFIDDTRGQLDFYSFHVYDYYREWDGEDFSGAILSGLPLEGVLDLVPNYTVLRYGRETPIVISETGGYSPQDKATGTMTYLEPVAAQHFPGSGFDREMKVRAMHDFLQLGSTIANTFAFMDHPHVVQKAVPFILLETSAWDPRYYATLYAPRDFDRTAGEWFPSSLHHFYQLFRDVSGRRVPADCPDPDIQVRAFVDGNRLFLLAHNLAHKPETLGFAAPIPASLVIRRHGRHADLRSKFEESTGGTLDSIAIGGRETLVLVAEYDSPLEATRTVEESIHYGDAVTVPVEDQAELHIALPEPAGIESAVLRIGYNRPGGSGKELRVLLNGTELQVPVEDSAPRYDHEKHGYSTTKLIPVDSPLLRAENTVAISFPDGGKGTVGSAVLRVRRDGS